MSVDRVEDLRADIRAWWAWRVELREKENTGVEPDCSAWWDNDDQAVDLLMRAAELLGVSLESEA